MKRISNKKENKSETNVNQKDKTKWNEQRWEIKESTTKTFEWYMKYSNTRENF